MLAKIVTAVALYFIYLLCCFLCTGTDRKNLIGLRSYPEKVQRLVKADPLLKDYIPKEKSIVSVLFSNFALFTVAFSLPGIAFKHLLGITNYLSAFYYFLVLGEGLGLFDLLVIDLLWWRNTKRIRFSILPQKEEYQNPSKHVNSFLRGIPLFAVVAAVVGLIVTLI